MQEDTGSHAASQLPEVGPSDALSGDLSRRTDGPQDIQDAPL